MTASEEEPGCLQILLSCTESDRMENNGGQIDILCSKEHKTVKFLQTVQAKYITVVQQSSHTVRDEKTLWTLIRLLLEEHSDQGSQHLPLLSKNFWKITIC